jgi:hypothetical protein
LKLSPDNRLFENNRKLTKYGSEMTHPLRIQTATWSDRGIYAEFCYPDSNPSTYDFPRDIIPRISMKYVPKNLIGEPKDLDLEEATANKAKKDKT